MASRKIVCLEPCGRVLPTPHDDIVQGLYERRTHGRLLGSATCDLCGQTLDKGDKVVALTTPHDYPKWESTYMAV